jgi:hypothetical protein
MVLVIHTHHMMNGIISTVVGLWNETTKEKLDLVE